MAHSLYMDVHIPAAITDGLRRNGLDVVTSQEDGTSTAIDEALLTRATSMGRLLFTCDEDFLAIGAAWQQSKKEFCGILFTAQLGLSIGRLIADITLIAELCTPEELANQVIYLPLK